MTVLLQYFISFASVYHLHTPWQKATSWRWAEVMCWGSVVPQDFVGESRVLSWTWAVGGFGGGAVSLSPCPGCSVWPADAGGAVCSAGWQTAAQLRLRLNVGMRAGEWNLHTSTPSAVELWPDWKIEEFRNRALGVLRKGVGSKGVCKRNVLKNLLMIRLFSWFDSLQFCFFLSLFSWSFSLLEFIKSPLLLAAF